MFIWLFKHLPIHKYKKPCPADAYGLYVRYESGGKYIGVYPDLKYTREVIYEIMDEVTFEVEEPIPTEKEMSIHLKTHDIFEHTFTDGTAILVMEVSLRCI